MNHGTKSTFAHLPFSFHVSCLLVWNFLPSSFELGLRCRRNKSFFPILKFSFLFSFWFSFLTWSTSLSKEAGSLSGFLTLHAFTSITLCLMPLCLSLVAFLVPAGKRNFDFYPTDKPETQNTPVTKFTKEATHSNVANENKVLRHELWLESWHEMWHETVHVLARKNVRKKTKTLTSFQRPKNINSGTK